MLEMSNIPIPYNFHRNDRLLNFLKLSCPFFSLTLSLMLGLKFFGECYMVFGGDWIFDEPFFNYTEHRNECQIVSWWAFIDQCASFWRLVCSVILLLLELVVDRNLKNEFWEFKECAYDELFKWATLMTILDIDFDDW